MKNIFLYFATIILLFLFSCQSKNKIDVSNINVKIEFHSFYKDFSAINPHDVESGIHALENKYPDFTNFYLEELLPWKVDKHNPAYSQEVFNFLTNKDYKNLLDTVNLFFPNTSNIDDKLIDAFKHIRYYDSAFSIPEHIYYFVSALNLYTAVLKDEDHFGIGLDMFLGEDYPHYPAVGIPQFATLRFNQESIPVWASQLIYQDRFPFETDNKNLLELMIQKGKEYLFLEKVLPELPSHVLFGYTEEQMNWAKDQEAYIYNYFIQNNLLYENNSQKILRFILESNSTPDFPNKSPGNIGSYLGWRIVSKYAKQKDLELKDVFKQDNAQQILTDARYKP